MIKHPLKDCPSTGFLFVLFSFFFSCVSVSVEVLNQNGRLVFLLHWYFLLLSDGIKEQFRVRF